jgi:hypothetical protein
MEIKIIIDDRIVKLVRRVFSRPLIAGAAALGALGGGAGVVYAVSATPTHTFTAGTTISSSEVNQNFAELYADLNALETTVADLPSPRAGCETAWAGCTAGEDCDLQCPNGSYIVGGGCDTYTAGDDQRAIYESYPTDTSGLPAGSWNDFTAYDTWHCRAEDGAALWTFAICCPP